MPVSYERLTVLTDQRGLVLELLAVEDFVSQRNAHIVVSLPGIVRGNHYHTKGLETITILGPSLVRIRDQGKIEEVIVPDKEAYRFIFLPGVSHAIKNLSREANILVAFNTLEHDPADPDTHRDLLI
jgi:dTDP-4-dehydrorhamnose 3,5-epimerase-like enzyme